MNLYLLTQTQVRGYDTFDAVVVAAPNEAKAKTIHPSPSGWLADGGCTWCDSPENVSCRLLGNASNEIAEGVILASFNAG